jgi:cytochrome c
MFDTMTLTKAIGALCGTFLIFLLINLVAENVYHVGGEGYDEETQNAYVIETDEVEDEEVEDEGVDFAALVEQADADKGARIYSKCKACHKLDDGRNGVGPHLFGVVSRDIASVDGYGYSGALKDLAGNWTPDALNGFLESPKAYVTGTKMSFSGLKKPQDRADLIAYLSTISG